jgi:uncharacterized protein YdeI (YjbR/CyaY-like superfamily)
MIFYKKRVTIDCITYNEALEEALCFGWIDSIIKKIDDERYVRKFTPRTNIYKWSELNKKKVLSLIEKGKMTKAGMEKIESWQKTGKVDWDGKGSKNESRDKNPDIPDFILKAFSKNQPALKNFNQLAPSYKRHYILWITSARREETILKRMKEATGLLMENRKLGLK